MRTVVQSDLKSDTRISQNCDFCLKIELEYLISVNLDKSWRLPHENSCKAVMRVVRILYMPYEEFRIGILILGNLKERIRVVGIFRPDFLRVEPRLVPVVL